MPRVTLSPQSVRYMNSIGISDNKGARPSCFTPLSARLQRLWAAFLSTLSHSSAITPTKRTVLRVLAIILGILVLIAIMDSVRASDDGGRVVSPVLGDSIASAGADPMVLNTVGQGLGSTNTNSRDSLDLSATTDQPPGLWVGVVLLAFLLIFIPVAITAFMVGFVEGMCLQWFLQRRRRPTRDEREPHSATESPGSWNSPDLTGLRPELNPTKCQRWWGLGLASVTGPVRGENQDHAIAWDQGPFRVIVVADGMGGEPRGKEAAITVTRTMSRHLAGRIADGSFNLRPLESINACFNASGGALKIRTGITGDTSGLRTTLIAVVVTPQTYFWSFIGDGGLWVFRQDGTVDNILTGHKDPDVPNVLFASMGPVVQGYPETGATARRPGDVLFVGSDGVFDRIPDPIEFSTSVVDAAREHFDGDLQRTVDEVVHQLSEAKDLDGNAICDDNLTLVVAAPDNVAPPVRASVLDREEPVHV